MAHTLLLIPPEGTNSRAAVQIVCEGADVQYQLQGPSKIIEKGSRHFGVAISPTQAAIGSERMEAVGPLFIEPEHAGPLPGSTTLIERIRRSVHPAQ